MKFAILALFTVAFTVIDIVLGGRIIIVPKGNPAKQSSKLTSVENPLLGNDGNINGTSVAGVQCFHTVGNEAMPWWIVDLQLTYLITGALVWNRIDGPCASRFAQASVAVTSNPSVWTTFSADLFDLCMYHPEVPTATDNPINFTCSRPIVGRYLTVYRTMVYGIDWYFHFCEIDVYAISNRDEFSSLSLNVQPSFSSTSKSLLVNVSSFARSDVECVHLCSIKPSCVAMLFKPASSECWFFNAFLIPSSFSSVINIGSANFLAVY